ncbi:hypothetical protein BHM03_00059715, partial [Ensete ventricosum]
LLICFDAAHQAPPPAPVQGGGSILGGIGSTIAQGYVIYLHFHFTIILHSKSVDRSLLIWDDAVYQVWHLARGVLLLIGQSMLLWGLAPSSMRPLHPKLLLQRRLPTHFSVSILQCINNYGSDIRKCQFYSDMLNECRRGSLIISDLMIPRFKFID